MADLPDEINKTRRTAIIYSTDELLFYIIEIHYQDNHYFLREKNRQLQQFGNLDDARNAAKQEGAEEAFLGLSNTYEEVDSTTDREPVSRKKYYYMPITL